MLTQNLYLWFYKWKRSVISELVKNPLRVDPEPSPNHHNHLSPFPCISFPPFFASVFSSFNFQSTCNSSLFRLFLLFLSLFTSSYNFTISNLIFQYFIFINLFFRWLPAKVSFVFCKYNFLNNSTGLKKNFFFWLKINIKNVVPKKIRGL